MTAGDITQLLEAIRRGDERAQHALYENVYQELRIIARSQRRRWTGNETLNTTALIHEAYAKLAKADGDYQNRAHFLATASRAMRHVLVNYAERSQAQKRSLPDKKFHEDVESSNTIEELLMINQLLEKLADDNPRYCRVVECRVFGGMSIEETAKALGVSAATVKRDWALLSAWLYRELSPQEEDK